MGPNASSYRPIKRRAKHSHQWREDANDDPRSGRPVSELMSVNIELLRQVISNDPHSIYDDIMAETSLSHSTIERIIRDCLTMRKVTSRWVPHQLSDAQKQEQARLFRENFGKIS